MNKDYQLRVIQCSFLMIGGVSDLELNKTFNFNEIDKSKDIINQLNTMESKI